MLRPPRPYALALALAVGAAGGWLAVWLQLPLPWMIGAMLAATAAALLGAPVAMWMPLRELMVAVLGVMLGSAFSPDILARLAQWGASLLALVAYSAAAAAVSLYFFRRMAHYDPVTSYFAAMPGGLSVMILMGEAFGGDVRVISLTHAARILLVVLALPFAFQLLLGYDPAARPTPGVPLLAIAPGDLAILAACGLAGFLGARALRVPAPAVVGPMLLSAAAHLGGLVRVGPPSELVAASQVIVGAAVGARFAGVSPAVIPRVLATAAGGTAILLAGTLAFALALDEALGLDAAAVALAFAPGGLAEMSLVALALGLDAAYVATHHIVRIALVVLLAPAVFRLLRRPPSASG